MAISEKVFYEEDALEQLIRARGLTKRQVSVAIGASPSYLTTAYQSGTSMPYALAVAGYLGVSVGLIIKQDETEEKKIDQDEQTELLREIHYMLRKLLEDVGICMDEEVKA